MRKLIRLRDEPIPERFIVLRMGANTLGDDSLRKSCDRSYAEWGIHAFSVAGVPSAGLDALARRWPMLAQRPKYLEARATDLLGGGFPLLPTLEDPHWSVVLSEPTPALFAKVRGHFRGPMQNPTWIGRRK